MIIVTQVYLIFTGHIDKVDEDRFMITGKFYKIDEIYRYLRKEHKDALKIIYPDRFGQNIVVRESGSSNRKFANVPSIKAMIVTYIGKSVFRDCSSLISVTIPASVTSIGEGAFRDCSSLISVTIPTSVTSIGEGAFRDCSSLTSVVIPDSVTSIEKGAFQDCSSLTFVTIPDSVTDIENRVFCNCSSL